MRPESEMNNLPSRRTRRKSKSSGLAVLGKAVLLVVVALGAFLYYPRIKALFPWPNASGPADTAAPSSEKPTQDVNILALGVDERPGDKGRSDTMILVNYNARLGVLHLLSIPRDTMVQLPGHGRQKINAAYAYGGPELAKQAVSNLLGINVDYYVKVNFQGFENIIDSLGGVNIDVKSKMDYDDPYQNLHIHFEPGLQHMTGLEALEYVRWRGDPRADLGRIERQRDFLVAVANQAITPGALARLPQILSQLNKNVDTDIPSLDQPGLAFSFAEAYRKGISSESLPGKPATLDDGLSYFLADKQKAKEAIDLWNSPPTAQGKTSFTS